VLGAEVWGMAKSEEIEKIQFQFCKYILLQVPTRAHTAAVMAVNFVLSQLPNIPYYPAKESIRITCHGGEISTQLIYQLSTQNQSLVITNASK